MSPVLLHGTKACREISHTGCSLSVPWERLQRHGASGARASALCLVPFPVWLPIPSLPLLPHWKKRSRNRRKEAHQRSGDDQTGPLDEGKNVMMGEERREGVSGEAIL